MFPFKKKNLKKRYKILRSNLRSPFKDFQYEIGKTYTCEDFDSSNTKCRKGFYATGIEGVLYSNLGEDKKVFECSDLKNLKKWASVRDSIWDSVSDSVGDSVRASAWGSVWGSVSDSTREYTSSLFPDIKTWKYVDHKEGKNPFQCGIDLWNRGFIPSFDGKTWRIHSGENTEIVFEISKKELEALND